VNKLGKFWYQIRILKYPSPLGCDWLEARPFASFPMFREFPNGYVTVVKVTVTF